jgi:predicted ATPase/DNA-binding SARP family transcriptional activator/Tfp pilus assembly protein PilF
MLEVKLLGQFEVQHGGRHLAIPTRHAQALFAYLVLDPGKMHRREQLAGLLWPDSSEENARSNLRHELWRLRKVIESDKTVYFQIDDLAISFNPQNAYFLDVHNLESKPLEASNEADLIEALSVYHGELLPGFYEEWVFNERERLHVLFEAKIARLMEILQNEERWDEVVDWGMRWTAVEQWSEPAYRALISAYANIGDISKAAATYERFTHGLAKDLGVKPSEQTQALISRLKTGWRTEPSRQAFSHPIQSIQSPPEIAVDSYPLPKVRRSNLPRPLTSFIGREQEIQQVEHLVSKARLVTITGPGGVGKTRLAIQAAGGLTTLYPDGVWWVELAPLFETTAAQQTYRIPAQGSQRRDPSIPLAEQKERSAAGLDTRIVAELAAQVTAGPAALVTMDIVAHATTVIVAQAVAKALRIPETPALSHLEGIVEFLQHKELLLVLDNCEHLIEGCVALAQHLLPACPYLAILATSREALGVPGEIAWVLPSLSLPKREQASNFSAIFQSEAVSLFIERAADVLPAYQPAEAEASVIAQICLSLDGIPLAIELAAARINLLSVGEIAARLDSRFSLLAGGNRTALPRHQTLRAAIEWSFDLLTEPERVLFRRLSIFAGSFTMEAAETICAGKDILKDEVLSLLGRLVDKSLLQVEPARPGLDLDTRYRYLDTICSFARLKLDEAGETHWMYDRHADYYLSLAAAAAPELLLQNAAHWHNRLRAENDNLRVMIEWSNESDQPERALRLVGALLWFWFLSGSNREGRDLALLALASPSTVQYRLPRAQALNTAGFLLCLLGDTASARQSLEEALAILRSEHDETSLAWTLQFLGLVFTNERRYDLAETAYQEGLSIIRRLESPRADNLLSFYGDVELQKGDRSRAKKSYEESVNILRATYNKSFTAYPLRRLGYLALEQDDISSAREYLRESLLLNHETNDRPGVTASLVSLAVLALHLDKFEAATLLFGAAERLLEAHSINLLYLDQVEHRRLHENLLACLDEASFKAEFSAGWELGEEAVIALAREI